MAVNNPTDLSIIQHKDDNGNFDRETDSLEFLGETQTHVTSLFPVSSANYVLFTAGGVNNTFGAWAELVDDANNKLSDAFASSPGHITGVLIEDLNVKDKRYLFELAYGDSEVIILRHRFLAGDVKKLAAIQHVRIRSVIIPAGEKLYYRLMCETAGKTCEVSFRYHAH
ncbi:unnamed protein product [marine sediment metagenome]|uniref:Uncharacterized protein n=1 Tax=marine sediment metagenome TaxID=412755 RepID=X1B1Z5_9ZZZZ